jgi:hypothetical protein
MMRAFLTKQFIAEPQPVSSGVRYGLLAAILALLVVNAWQALFRPPAHGRYDGLILPLMLLFNSLAFVFRWSPPVTLVLRILAWAWTVAGTTYVIFTPFAGN